MKKNIEKRETERDRIRDRDREAKIFRWFSPVNIISFMNLLARLLILPFNHRVKLSYLTLCKQWCPDDYKHLIPGTENLKWFKPACIIIFITIISCIMVCRQHVYFWFILVGRLVGWLVFIAYQPLLVI